jgi:hypothetical protein
MGMRTRRIRIGNPAAIMRIQVSEDGDAVCIALCGVAGRHQRILQALTQCPYGPGLHATVADDDGAGAAPEDDGPGAAPARAAGVSIRAGADEMHIRIAAGPRNHAAPRLEALSIYHYLRHVLVERGAAHALDRRQPVTSD